MKVKAFTDADWDTIIETLELDCRSHSFSSDLRAEISEAIERIEDVSPTTMQFPLPVGAMILSKRGEQDEGEDGERSTGPNAVGVVVEVVVNDLAKPGQKYHHHVQFKDSGVWVILHEEDLAPYQVFDAPKVVS